MPKAIPYGIYDLGADTGSVSVGVDHDTAPFAFNSIGPWWDDVGRAAYPTAPAADHRRLWRFQRLPAAGLET